MATNEEVIPGNTHVRGAMHHVQEAAQHLSDAAMFLHFGGQREAGDKCSALVQVLRELLRRQSLSVH